MRPLYRNLLMIVASVMLLLGGVGLERYVLSGSTVAPKKPVSFDSAKFKANQEAAQKAAEEKEAKKVWDILPIKVVPEYGTVPLPKVATISLGVSAPDINGFVPRGSDLEKQLREQLLKIMAANPDPEIAQVYKAFISDPSDPEYIDLAFGSMPPGMYANYQLWPKDNVVTAEVREREMYVSLITVSAVFASGAATNDDILNFYSIIVHEYSHYLEAQDEDWKIFVSKKNPQNTFLSSDQCQKFWEVETSGFLAGAEAGVRFGTRNDFSARVADKVAFHQFMFINGLGTYLNNFPECTEVWAKNAGHPHPEAFSDYGKDKQQFLKSQGLVK